MTKYVGIIEQFLKLTARLLWRSKKSAMQFVAWRPTMAKRVLFVVGCQKSGATLLQKIFERATNTKVYPECSWLASRHKATQLRLDPLPQVKVALDRDLAALVVLQPLVDTQNILQLLRYFPGSKAVFLYRNYEDVAACVLKQFGRAVGINDLRFIVSSQPDNWRTEHVTQTVRDVIQTHFSESMNPCDAAALFWYARNSLYFDLELSREPAVMLCKFEDLLIHPLATIRGIYDFVGVAFKATPSLVRNMPDEPFDTECGIELSAPVRELCAGLLARLDGAYRQQREAGRQIVSSGSLAR